MSSRSSEQDVRATLDTTLQHIREDREHGASWLAREAACALLQAASRKAADAGERVRTLHSAARAFAAARPSMAALANAAAAIWGAGTPHPTEASEAPSDARACIERMRVEARRILDAEEQA